jgi:hypothetical protein
MKKIKGIATHFPGLILYVRSFVVVVVVVAPSVCNADIRYSIDIFLCVMMSYVGYSSGYL